MASLRTTPLLLLLLSLTLTAAKPQFRRLFDDLSEDLTKREGRQDDPVQELADAVVEEVQENIKEELEERVRVPEQLSGTWLFGLESTKLLCVGLTQNISFQYIVEAMF